MGAADGASTRAGQQPHLQQLCSCWQEVAATQGLQSVHRKPQSSAVHGLRAKGILWIRPALSGLHVPALPHHAGCLSPFHGREAAGLDSVSAADCLLPDADLYDAQAAASVSAVQKPSLTGACPQHHATHRCIKRLHGASALGGAWSAAMQTLPALANTMHDHAMLSPARGLVSAGIQPAHRFVSAAAEAALLVELYMRAAKALQGLYNASMLSNPSCCMQTHLCFSSSDATAPAGKASRLKG